MTGKQHLTVGVALGLGLGIAMNYVGIKSNHADGLNSASNILVVGQQVRNIVFSGIIGGLGALVPDIDTSKSIIARQFTKLITILIWIFALSFVMKIPIIDNASKLFKNNIFIIIFAINLTLGKMSPHRGYTHKFLGTLVFLICAYNIFTFNYFLAFTLGYLVGHIVMDGEIMHFFEFRLPFVTSKGKVRIHH